jgi:hypothetical protein
MPEHSTITDPYLHEPKGVASAQEGKFYVANGAGSGTWKYLPTGWGSYTDNAGAQVFGTTATKLLVNKLGAALETKLPWTIRGVGTLLNDSKITPVASGDSYMVRVTLPVTAKTGSPATVLVTADIGAGAAISVPISVEELAVTRTPNYTLTANFLLFTGDAALANGVQFFVGSDAGTVTVTNPSIFISRISAGDF